MNKGKSAKSKPANLRAEFTTRQAKRIPEPPTVKDDIVANFRVQFNVAVTPGTVAFVNASQLRDVVPGMASASGPVWSRFRVNRIDVWGPDAAGRTNGNSNSIRVATAAFPDMFRGGDLAAFKDAGTAGQSRAHVGIIPNMFARMAWMDTQLPDTQSIFTIESQGPADEVQDCIVQMSIELRSASAVFVK